MSNQTNNCSSGSSRVWTGIVIMAVGAIFLLKNIGVHIPAWVISWHMLLIVIGLLIGYKRRFEGIGWLIMILIGGYFTLQEISNENLSRHYFAAAFIIFGLCLIFKPKRTNKRFRRSHMGNKWERWERRFGHRYRPLTDDEEKGAEGSIHYDDSDILEAVSLFGGSNQYINSKKFKGGDAIAVFGGCAVNLTQADFEGTIELEIVVLFGGIKIIIPSSWEVKSDVVTIFGGLEDRRALGAVSSEPRKLIKIKGVAIFGGVDIRNF